MERFWNFLRTVWATMLSAFRATGRALRAFGRTLRSEFTLLRSDFTRAYRVTKRRVGEAWNWLRDPKHRERAKHMWSKIREVGNALGISLAIGASIVLWGFLLYAAPLSTLIALAIFAGVMVALSILPLFPGLMENLTNRPNRLRPRDPLTGLPVTSLTYPADKSGFFTGLEPGQVKIIETEGGSFVRAIMGYEGHKLRGEKPDNSLHPRDDMYWEVEDSGPYPDTHPIPFPQNKVTLYTLLWALYAPISIVWWLWKRYVYRLRGAIFTGIPGFRNIRVYPMERFKEFNKADGKTDLIRVEDYSDHLRVQQFLYPVVIPDADTQDKIPVRAHFDVIAKVVNPYQTTYNTDGSNWTRRLIASVSSVFTTFTRSTPVDNVISAADPAVADALGVQITAGATARTRIFGIELDETNVRDISAVNPEDRTVLGERARANVRKEARKLQGEGDASYIDQTGAALRRQPHGAVLAQIDGAVRAAEAVGKREGLVVIGGQALDLGQAALVRADRRASRGGAP